MALIKGTNSYATADEADTYFETRLDVAAWNDASSDSKEQALVTATQYLETLRWTGVAISTSQSLSFPREGYFFDNRLGYYDTLPTTVPDAIVTATCELAYHFLNNDGILDDTGSVKDLSVGQIRLNLAGGPNKLPRIVRLLVKPYLVTGIRNWFRSN